MKDFQTLNETPYYENLNSGSTDNQNYSSQHQAITPINQQNQNDVRDAIYKSPTDVGFYFFCCIFFFVGIFASSLMITIWLYEKEIVLILTSPIPLIFTVVGSVLGINYNFSVNINISSTLATIKITHRNMFCCYNKEKIIHINEVQKIIYTVNDGTFSINFKLSDEREVNGWINVNDKNLEGRRAFEILRNSLPKTIIFEGNIDN